MPRTTPHNTRRILATAACLSVLMLCLTGCGERRIDETKLYKGMDRSAIIAYFGAPDKRKSHPPAERLTYLDGKHYQYLLLLMDDKLVTWHHDRIYKANRFSSIKNWEEEDDKQKGGR